MSNCHIVRNLMPWLILYLNLSRKMWNQTVRESGGTPIALCVLNVIFGKESAKLTIKTTSMQRVQTFIYT